MCRAVSSDVQHFCTLAVCADGLYIRRYGLSRLLVPPLCCVGGGRLGTTKPCSGVPDYKYPALDQGTIMAELEKKYPDFEKRTGWRLDSEYKEEIPEALAKEVLTS